MADRVVFIPGFPYSFTAGVTDPTHPIAIPIEDIAQLKYRVRNWGISTDGSCTSAGVTYPAPSGVMAPFSPVPTRELDLLDANGHIFQISSPPSLATLEYLITDDQVFSDSGVFYPYINIDIAWQTGAFFVRISSNPFIPGYIVIGSFVGSILGYPITLYLCTAPGGDPVTATFCDFIPVEYWPYAARDGSPIWDTTTGAQLQDPLNAL